MILLRNLHVEGFGVHHDLRLDFGAGLNLIEGPNEAGKSTLHAFLTTILYGSHKAVHPPLAGGRHGGAVVLASKEGDVRVERRFKPRFLRVEREDGSDGGEALLRELLGRIDAQLYNSVFAFDLQDLLNLSTLESNEIEHYLFDAGLLGAGGSFRELMKTLDAEHQELLRPRSGKMREIHRELNALRKELRDAQEQAAQYGDLVEQELEIAKELEALRRSIAEKEAARTRLQLCIDLWPLERRRVEAQGVLQGLPPAREGEPAAALLTRLDRVEGQLAQVSERVEARAGEIEKLRLQIAGLTSDDALLAAAPRVEALRGELAAQRVHGETLLTLGRAIEEREAKVEALLRSLGPEWTREAALEVDCSLPEQERREQAAAALKEATEEKERQEALLAQRREELRRAEEAERSERGALEALGTLATEEELVARQAALTELRVAWEEVRRVEPRLDALRDRESLAPTQAPRGVIPWLAVVAVFGAAIALAVQQAWLLGGAAAALAILFAFLLRGEGKRQPEEIHGEARSLRQQIEAAEAALREHQAAIARASGLLGLPEDPSAAEVERAAGELAEDQRKRQRWLDLHELHQRAQRVLAAARIDVKAAEEGASQAHARWEEAAKRWAEVVAPLAAGGETPEPTAAEERAKRILRLQELSEANERSEAERRRLEEAVSRWESEVAALLREVGLDEAGEGGLAALHDRIEAERGKAEERRVLEVRHSVLAQDQEKDLQQKAALGKEAQKLLDEAGTEDRAALEKLAEEETRRDAALRAIEEAEQAFAERLGEGEEADNLLAELATGQRVEWEERRDALVAELEEAVQLRDQKIAEEATLRTQREALEASADVPRKAAAVASKEQELREAARRWRRAKLLKHVLEEALEELHKSKQPAVLRRAAESFSRVTGGRYVRIRQSLDEKQVEVVDADGRSVAAKELSRGTQEQLYLCLRLGLAAAFADQGIRLPLLMDDVLVNFDPERADAMAQVLADFAKEQQVLLFTCHPQTAERLRRVAPDATSRRLER